MISLKHTPNLHVRVKVYAFTVYPVIPRADKPYLCYRLKRTSPKKKEKKPESTAGHKAEWWDELNVMDVINQKLISLRFNPVRNTKKYAFKIQRCANETKRTFLY